MLFGETCKLLIIWSGRRDSNPRRPAWEHRPLLKIHDLCVHGVHPDHYGHRVSTTSEKKPLNGVIGVNRGSFV